MDSHVRKLVEHILDNYSEYIDNLQIQELIHLLEGKNDDLYWHLADAIREIVQLIVDDLGCDIVNKIETADRVFYRNVKFKDHVVIRKHVIADYEFYGASFLKGVTVKNYYLPKRALMSCDMSGIIDLTQVEVLGDDNLNYYIPRPEGCKVLLSNKLTALMGTSVFRFSPNVKVEYRGTILQLTKLVKDHYELWTIHQRTDFIRMTGQSKIKCDDGVWTIDEYVKLAKTLK